MSLFIFSCEEQEQKGIVAAHFYAVEIGLSLKNDSPFMSHENPKDSMAIVSIQKVI